MRLDLWGGWRGQLDHWVSRPGREWGHGIRKFDCEKVQGRCLWGHLRNSHIEGTGWERAPEFSKGEPGHCSVSTPTEGRTIFKQWRQKSQRHFPVNRNYNSSCIKLLGLLFWIHSQEGTAFCEAIEMDANCKCCHGRKWAVFESCWWYMI